MRLMCGQGTPVRSRYARGAVEVRSCCSRGALVVQSRCARGAVEVRSWCSRGTLMVQSRYARGAVEVRFWYTHRRGSGSVRYLNFLSSGTVCYKECIC